MGRQLRVQEPGQCFHVVSRGVRRSALAIDDVDRHLYVRLLGITTFRHRWRCLAYCLMSNHVHLLIELRAPTLSTGMQYLNGAYARAFNKRHGYVGHAFETRFHSSLIATEQHLAAALRYIALNPVTAGICGDPAEWPWSSYRATAGLDAPPAFLATHRVRALFTPRHQQRDAYVAFIRDELHTRDKPE